MIDTITLRVRIRPRLLSPPPLCFAYRVSHRDLFVLPRFPARSHIDVGTLVRKAPPMPTLPFASVFPVRAPAAPSSPARGIFAPLERSYPQGAMVCASTTTFFFFLSSSCFGSHMGWILEGSFEFISVCHQHRLSCFFIFFYRLRFLCPPWPRLHSISPPPSSRYRPLIDAKMSADGIEMSLWITLRIARKMLIASYRTQEFHLPRQRRYRRDHRCSSSRRT